DGAAVHVTIEDVHEYRNARHRALGQTEFPRRHRLDDAAHPAVGGRHDNALSQRRGPPRGAEEPNAPDGARPRDDAQRFKQPEQNQGDEREQTDEGIALPMDRHELWADGVEDGHEITPLHRRARSRPRRSAARSAGYDWARRPRRR